MKALMVMPSMLLSSVPDAFAKAGFQIHLAENATFALTMLERDQPDLIVSSDQLGDMTGRDLYEIVRSDPALNAITFILLDGTTDNKLQDSAKELELSWMTAASEIVKAAKDLLGLSNAVAPVSSRPPATSLTSKAPLPPRDNQGSAGSVNTGALGAGALGAGAVSNSGQQPKETSAPNKPATMFPSKAVSISRTGLGSQSGQGSMKSRQVGASGTLEIFTLFDLAVSLTSNLKIGKLFVRIVEEEGMIFFYKGALTHAEYKTLTGESALLKIFGDADEFKSDTEFIFEPLEGEALSQSFQTITNTIDKLLFNVAVELDHQREAKARAKEAQKA
jgi:CheY-like chemotaxis protein